MADNFTQFSSGLANLTGEQINWLKQQLDDDLLQAAYEHQSDLDCLGDLPQDEREKAFAESFINYAEGMDYTDDRPHPRKLVLLKHYAEEAVIGFQHAFQKADDGSDFLWIYAEEHGNLEAVADLVQAYLKKFNRDGVWVTTWSESCNRPRLDQFGGGAMVVTAEEVHWMDAHRWADEQVGRVHRRKKVEKLTLKLIAHEAPDDCLDDLVHQLASMNASATNNSGFAEQVEFILEQMGDEGGETEVRKYLKHDEADEEEQE